MGGLGRFWILVSLVITKHHAKKFQESVNFWQKKIENSLGMSTKVSSWKEPLQDLIVRSDSNGKIVISRELKGSKRLQGQF